MLGSTGLAQKVVLAGAPVLAAILTYRAAMRLTGRPGPSVLASAVYVLCGLTLWSFSEGRLALLVALAVLPAIFERVETAFGRQEPSDGRWRFVAGVGVTLAVLVAFLPGAVLAVGVLVVVQLVAGPARLRGLGSMALASVIAAVLLFPFVPTLVAGGGVALVSQVGTSDLVTARALGSRRGSRNLGGRPLPAGGRARVVRAGGRRAPRAGDPRGARRPDRAGAVVARPLPGGFRCRSPTRSPTWPWRPSPR